MPSVVATAQWTDQFLDMMRGMGDLPADRAIELWRQYGPNIPLRQLAERLVGFEHAQEIDLLIDLLTQHSPMAPVVDPRLRVAECGCTQDELDAGHHLFEAHGLKILMILVFYSLPSAYAAQNGVRVLHGRRGGTGYFVKDMNRRLIETTQFVIDVMTREGLHIDRSGSSTAAHGPAVRSTMRVRLLHAAVRALIEAHGPPPWDAPKLGKPVNQEDMAGTLLTFSWVVLDGLRQLRLDVDPATEQAYFRIWQKVGLLLGVDPHLIPATLNDAEALMREIKRRQIDTPIAAGIVNEDGIEMTSRLLNFIRDALPVPGWVSRLPVIRNLPCAVMRFFLPGEVATSLGIPRSPILDRLVKWWFYFEARVTRWAFYDTLNRAVYVEWGARDRRVGSLFQMSRFFNKRLVRHIQGFDRNAPLADGHRQRNIDLHGWDITWAFDQTDVVTRGIRHAKKRVQQMSRRSSRS